MALLRVWEIMRIVIHMKMLSVGSRAISHPTDALVAMPLNGGTAREIKA